MKSVIFGMIGGLVTCGALAAFSLESGEVPNNRHGQKRSPYPMYEVVDTYEGCDVIRYTDKFGYVHYFSHCGTKQ